MRHKIAVTYSLLLLATVSSISCEKEDQRPDIEIISPENGRNVRYNDTLEVEVEASDFTSDFRLSLLDGASPVGINYRKVFEDGDRHVFDIYFRDRYLPSGEYDLRVTAVNGDASKSAFRKLQYRELPLRLLGVALQDGGSIDYIDSAGNRQAVTGFAGLQNMLYSGRLQALGALDSDGSRLELYDVREQQQVGSYSASSLPFRFLKVFRDNFYLFRSDGEILAVDLNSVKRRYRLPDNFNAENAAFSDDWLLVSAYRDGSDLRELFTFKLGTSTHVQRQAQRREPVFMAGWQEDEFALAEADGQGGVQISSYNPSNLTTTKVANLENESPLRVIPDDQRGVYLKTDQNVYAVAGPNSVFPLKVLSFSPAEMEAARNQSLLYYTDGNTIKIKGSGNPQVGFTASQQILNFSLIYNK